MSKVTESIKEELIKICNIYNDKYDYDFWNEHIKHVVKNAVELAERYNADIEIVELGALLHDIAMPSEFGPSEEHNVYGAKIADELLTKLNYPEYRKERVKECILRHRGSKELPRNTVEEQCVADADVIAHFDCIPSLFHLVYADKKLSVKEGEEFLKKKLERDYNKLSDRTREMVKDRYNEILRVLFVNK